MIANTSAATFPDRPARFLEGQIPKRAGDSKAAAGATCFGLHNHPPAVAEVDAASSLTDTLAFCGQVGLVVPGQLHSLPCSAKNCPAISTMGRVKHLAYASHVQAFTCKSSEHMLKQSCEYRGH